MLTYKPKANSKVLTYDPKANSFIGTESHAKSTFTIANPKAQKYVFSKSPLTLATASNLVAKQAADLLLRDLTRLLRFHRLHACLH